MLRRTLHKVLAAVLFLSAGTLVSAQDGAYGSFTPYSIFGVGDLAMPGSAYQRSMGGVGLASRNNRFLNTLNPAAVTARDTMSVMMDFSVFNDNRLFRQRYEGSSLSSANNLTNVGLIAFSLPVWRKISVMGGITPYSSVGYKYKIQETDPAVISAAGSNVSYTDSGQGSLYKLFFGAGMPVGKRLSVGAQADYYFGKIEKKFVQDFARTGYNEIQETYTMNLHALSGKFGLQYEVPLPGRAKLGLGATYALAANMRGMVRHARDAVGAAETVTLVSDTLHLDGSKVQLSGELGLGVSFSYADKFRAEFNYLRSDWSGSGMNSVEGFANPDAKLPFRAGVRNTFRLGMEYVPNRNDIRYYYKKWAYRAGLYYSDEYYAVAGHGVATAGISFGATLPVFRWYNGLSVAVDLGQRGGLQGGLIRERYIRLSFGVNLFDIWFQKPRYE